MLDDIRRFQDISYPNSVYDIIHNEELEIITCTNYQQFCDCINKNNLPRIVSFDHDITLQHYKNCNRGGRINYNLLKEKTGYDCAKFLIDYCIKNNLKLPKYYVHSMNPVGKANIIQLLRKFELETING